MTDATARAALAGEKARWENDDRTLYPDSEVLASLERIAAALRAPTATAVERVLREARRFADPDGDPTRLGARALISRIDAILSLSPSHDGAEAEPVAWSTRNWDGVNIVTLDADRAKYWQDNLKFVVEPLYAAPLATRDAGAVRAGVSAVTKLAAECHRAKWQFDLNEDYKPTARVARDMISNAFKELHRIGDIAMKERDALCSVPADNHANSEGGK